MKKVIIGVLVVALLGGAYYFMGDSDLVQGRMSRSNLSRNKISRNIGANKRVSQKIVTPAAPVVVPVAAPVEVSYDISVGSAKSVFKSDIGTHANFDLNLYLSSTDRKYRSYEIRYVMQTIYSEAGFDSGNVITKKAQALSGKVHGSIPVKVALPNTANATAPTHVYVTAQFLGYDKSGDLIGKGALVRKKLYIYEDPNKENVLLMNITQN